MEEAPALVVFVVLDVKCRLFLHRHLLLPAALLLTLREVLLEVCRVVVGRLAHGLLVHVFGPGAQVALYVCRVGVLVTFSLVQRTFLWRRRPSKYIRSYYKRE